ncbi:two-component system, OmpR family, sensor histidine kinase PhoQ [Oceanospirillum multiglobuliferum]|uniref:histidine kinase n=1 Tax=Oceanospirillum multiglobuliferum TaxID=64969 RepID=A0A1T4PEH1_9GAMM|nr:ATP-binding protein [Oceanospirillum multiglobuliferum]OPX55585.1 hypothetical protein BTE48_08190 [Oceanospirillum multiglobuliferum]SJZ89965.1 two-component system, OmpR family, sensor histidine kinase PhoQ [Oceanospirillum multiglobuliferum]
MTQISLRRRFFLHSAITLVIVMCVSLFVMDYSYRSELEQSSAQRLRLHIFNLLSVAEKKPHSLSLPDILRNPRFNTLNSGLWALVLDYQLQPLWHSLSLGQVPDLNSTTQETGTWVWQKQTINGQVLLTMSYTIAWDTPNGLERYQFVVAEDETFIQQELTGFRWWLGSGFSLITLSLLLGQHLVLRSSFKPINTLEKEIRSLEKGEQKQLSRTYPAELFGVTTNLNALIRKEHTQREKYRAAMADLAHSLKTPLAIVKGELQLLPNKNDVLQKAMVRIDQSIEYQLRRAVISGHSLLHQGTSITEVLDDLIDVLNHAYRDSNLVVEIDVDSDAQFYGDENDLMEILGNLLDNAFRYAKKTINIYAKQDSQQLILTIEDDGEGFSNDQAIHIFKRGERLDSQGFGQGIGLSVVFDIVNSYDGGITAGRSTLGGACFTLTFPTQKGDE